MKVAFIVKICYSAVMSTLTTMRILSDADENFHSCWELYQSSFPEEERRDHAYQLAALECEEYHFAAILKDEDVVGLMAWWSFDSLIYIEHFAIMESCRSHGYGKEYLCDFVRHIGKPILLEVEPPTEDIRKRRIGFYERLGFHLNEHDYAQPPYRGDEFVPLMLMTSPYPISMDDVERFKRECFPIIHFRYFR